MVTPVACFSIDMILYNCIHLQTRITNNGFLSASLQSDPSSTSSSHSLLSVTLEPWPASPSLIVWCSTYLRTGSTASGGTRSCEAWAENWSRRTTSRWWGARNLNKREYLTVACITNELGCLNIQMKLHMLTCLLTQNVEKIGKIFSPWLWNTT